MRRVAIAALLVSQLAFMYFVSTVHRPFNFTVTDFSPAVHVTLSPADNDSITVSLGH